MDMDKLTAEERNIIIQEGVNDSEITFLDEDDMTERYDTMLRECCSEKGDGEIQVCGLTYDNVTVFKEIDPTAYRCGFVDWASMEEDVEEWDNGWIISQEAYAFIDNWCDEHEYCDECGDLISMDEYEDNDGMCNTCKAAAEEAEEAEEQDD